MPELPELEIVREVLTRRLVGRRVEEVRLKGKGAPIVVRDLTAAGFVEGVRGATLEGVERRGKFLLLRLAPSGLVLAVNPKLTGRFQLCPPGEKKAGPVHVTFVFDAPLEELRYVDSKMMGQVYLTPSLEAIPTFSEMGPDALEVDLDEFRRRLRSFRGEIKGILVRATFRGGDRQRLCRRDPVAGASPSVPETYDAHPGGDRGPACRPANDLDLGHRPGPSRHGGGDPSQAARFLLGPHARRPALPALRNVHLGDHRPPTHHIVLSDLPARRPDPGDVTLDSDRSSVAVVRCQSPVTDISR